MFDEPRYHISLVLEKTCPDHCRTSPVYVSICSICSIVLLAFKVSLVDAYIIAFNLTMIAGLAKYCIEHWPECRSERPDLVPVYVGSVLVVFGSEGVGIGGLEQVVRENSVTLS